MTALGAVATIDARAAFVMLPLPEGGFGAFCRGCGAEVRLDDTGRADARDMRHEPECEVGRLLAAATKPLFLQFRTMEATH